MNWVIRLGDLQVPWDRDSSVSRELKEIGVLDDDGFKPISSIEFTSIYNQITDLYRKGKPSRLVENQIKAHKAALGVRQLIAEQLEGNDELPEVCMYDHFQPMRAALAQISTLESCLARHIESHKCERLRQKAFKNSNFNVKQPNRKYLTNVVRRYKRQIDMEFDNLNRQS